MTGGLGIVGDLITWAKDPTQPIPVVSPGEGVRLSIGIVNRGRLGRMAKLRTWSPSRDAMLDERLVVPKAPIDVTTSVAYEWNVPPNAPLGIYHVDYVLLDAAGQIVQADAEATTGRFAVATPEVRRAVPP
jgi:hypothetical protein